jgi:hypothetical protein
MEPSILVDGDVIRIWHEAIPGIAIEQRLLPVCPKNPQRTLLDTTTLSELVFVDPTGLP